MIRAVLFDAAGTLIEPRETVGETYAREAREFGVRLSARRLDEAFRRTFAQAEPMVFPELEPHEAAERERDWWREIVRRTFLAADSSARLRDFDTFFARLWALYSDPAAWRPLPGAREILRDLRARGLRTAVVSNFDQRLPKLLAGLGLADSLDAVVLPAEARAAKPAAPIFELALARLGVAASDAVFVGDHGEHDLAGARAAGLRAIDASSLATLVDLDLRGEGGEA